MYPVWLKPYAIAQAFLLPTLQMLSPVAPVRADEWRKQLGAVPALVNRAPAGSSAINRCWVSGALDRGVNDRVAIRAAPRPDARVLRTIPSFRLEGGERIAPEFMVIGARAGWLLIHDVGFAGYDAPARRLLAGSGWIEARRIHVQIESFRLHRDPDPTSRLAADMTPSSPAEAARLVTVHGCSGSMLDLTMRLADGRTARGWSGGACSNQVTTCGGGHRIAIEKDGRIVPADDD
jgi:hypothetical protein